MHGHKDGKNYFGSSRSNEIWHTHCGLCRHNHHAHVVVWVRWRTGSLRVRSSVCVCPHHPSSKRNFITTIFCIARFCVIFLVPLLDIIRNRSIVRVARIECFPLLLRLQLKSALFLFPFSRSHLNIFSPNFPVLPVPFASAFSYYKFLWALYLVTSSKLLQPEKGIKDFFVAICYECVVISVICVNLTRFRPVWI